MPRFAFRPIPLLATVVGALIFLRLGWWQWHKADLVQAQVQAFAARSQQPAMRLSGVLVPADDTANRAVTVRGSYEAQAQFLLDNQQENGQPGVHVITPLRIEGSDTRVLVDRGWIGWGTSRATLPQAAPPDGVVTVHGIAQIPSHKKRLWVSEDLGNSAQLQTRIDLDRYRTETGFAVQPIVLLQDPHDADDGLIRHWPAPEDKTMMHRGYAVQWLLITLALVAFFLVASHRQAKAQRSLP